MRSCRERDLTTTSTHPLCYNTPPPAPGRPGSDSKHLLVQNYWHPYQEYIVQSLLEKPESGRLSVKHAKPEKQSPKSSRTTGIPHKRHIFPRQMHQWRGDIGKLRDKTPVVSHKSQKLSHTLQTVWDRP